MCSCGCTSPECDEDISKAYAEGFRDGEQAAILKTEAYQQGFRAGQLDAQYDNDTLPEQIAAYKRLAYEQGFNAAREKANGIVEHKPRCQFEFCDICEIAQRIGELLP